MSHGHPRLPILGNPGAPMLRPSRAPMLTPSRAPFGEAGRGLHVVQALSATWGWARLSGSRKAVWAAMGVPGADAGQQTHSRSG
jgi:hypothetical protein